MPSGSTDKIERTVNVSQSSLSYDANTQQYTYKWKTVKSWKNTCRELTVKLDNNSLHKALFRFTN